MKAALCTELSGPQGLNIVEVDPPVCGPGHVLIDVKAVGLNFADTLITRGKYQYKPELPFAPGAEIAGIVAEAGTGVTSVTVGDRVLAYVGWGGAAERLAVGEELLVPLPRDVPFDVASGLSVTYGTAMHGLKHRGLLQPGETIVVTGAAGGAGLAAIEVAKLLGARVIAVASSPEKLETARRAGADETVLFPGSDLKAAIKSLTGGKGADVVYDCIGGEAAEPLVRSLGWQGRFLVIGFAAGEIPKLPLNLLLVKGAAAIGVFWGESVRRDPSGHRQGMIELLRWVAEGRLHPRIHAKYPLDRIRDALAVLDQRAAQGKVVVTL